jgi:hypothetical protein
MVPLDRKPSDRFTTTVMCQQNMIRGLKALIQRDGLAMTTQIDGTWP